MARRYRPFLVYNPRLGWAFYRNRWAYSLTTTTIGAHRKTMRERFGWFLTPELAAMFEKAAR